MSTTPAFQPYTLLGGGPVSSPGSGNAQGGGKKKRRPRKPSNQPQGESATQQGSPNPAAGGAKKQGGRGGVGGKGGAQGGDPGAGGKGPGAGKKKRTAKKKDQPAGAAAGGPSNANNGTKPAGKANANANKNKAKNNNRNRNNKKNNDNKTKNNAASSGLARQVFEEPLMRLTILKHLNPYNIDDLKGIIALKQLGLLPTEELRYYFTTVVPTRPMLEMEEREFELSEAFIKEFGLDVNADRFLLHEKMEDDDIKDVVREDLLGKIAPEDPAARKWLKGRKRKDVWLKYGFLSYVPKTVYMSFVRGKLVLQEMKSKQFRGLPRERRLGAATVLLSEACEVGMKNEVIDSLIGTYGADPNALVIGSISMLHIAASFGHTETIRHLVGRHGLDPSAICLQGMYRGNTLAHFAAGSGRLDTLRLVCEDFKVKPNAADACGITPLHWAAIAGSAECVEYLVDQHGLDPDQRTKLGQTAAMLAADAGSLETLRLLSDKYNVDLHAVDKSGEGVLHAAMVRGHEYLLKLLVGDHMLDVNLKSKEGKAPVHKAAAARSIACFRGLVDTYGADPKAVTAEGATVAHYAARENNRGMLRLLFDTYKLDPKAQTTAGKTCCDWATMVDATEAAWMLEDEYDLIWDPEQMLEELGDETDGSDFDDDDDDDDDDDGFEDEYGRFGVVLRNLLRDILPRSADVDGFAIELAQHAEPVLETGVYDMQELLGAYVGTLREHASQLQSGLNRLGPGVLAFNMTSDAVESLLTDEEILEREMRRDFMRETHERVLGPREAYDDSGDDVCPDCGENRSLRTSTRDPKTGERVVMHRCR